MARRTSDILLSCAGAQQGNLSLTGFGYVLISREIWHTFLEREEVLREGSRGNNLERLDLTKDAKEKGFMNSQLAEGNFVEEIRKIHEHRRVQKSKTDDKWCP